MIRFKYDDGGRAAAGYKGKAADCVCRAIAIAAQLPYQQVYDALAEGNATQRRSRRLSARAASRKPRPRSAAHGISAKRKWFKDYMRSLGFEWVPTMGVGTGCRVHVRASELPQGRLVLNVSKHMCAVIDGVLHDTYDCSRGGTRCVYGYYIYRGAQ
jgi:hypothetical protein